MKKIIFSFLLLGWSATASAALLTFDDLGLGFGDTFAGNEYAAFGVNFSTDDVRLGMGGTTGSLPNSLGAHETTGNDFNGNILIDFDAGFHVTDLKFTIFNTPFNANAFDVNGTLVHSIVSSSGFTQTFDFTGFNVNSVVIDGTFYAIDDVQFGSLVAAVPEPSIIALFGFGLLGLGLARRRKV